MALLGSERTHLEPALEEALRHYRVDPEDPLPQVILSGAATLHQLRKIEILSRPFTAELPEPVGDEDLRPSLTADSLLHLKQILSGRYQRALTEFVQLLATGNWLLPAEFLPELLEAGRQNPELWHTIQPLLGQRAYWLIAQHPDWRALAPGTAAEDWAQSGPAIRKQILAQVRQKAPEQASLLLSPDWATTDFRQKLTYLDQFVTGLGPPDEDFLEQCLDDSRKEVRQKAAELLASLPGSRLVARIFESALPCFRYTAGRRLLEVELPNDIPTGSGRDGVNPSAAKGPSGGLKVSWLAECVGRIPPAKWKAHFDWQTTDLILAFEGANRANLLLGALGEACLRFNDVHTSTQLLQHIVLGTGAVPDSLRWQALTKLLPATAVQEMAAAYFQQQPGLLEEQHLLTRILELGAQPWDEALTRLLIQGLKQWMRESRTFLWNLWHYKRLLEIAGYCSPVSLFDELNADWPVDSPVWNQWAPDIERMLRILRFRKEMTDQLVQNDDQP